MTTHNVPNDVLGNLDPFALIILIPVCDFFVRPSISHFYTFLTTLQIYPAIRRMGFKFTALKKIVFGFFTGSAAMIWTVCTDPRRT